jgi:hypothetical protein
MCSRTTYAAPRPPRRHLRETAHAGLPNASSETLDGAVQDSSPTWTTSVLGRLLPRRVTTSAARPCPARQPRPSTQPQERRVDAYSGRRPFGLNGRSTARHVSRPTQKTTLARATRVFPTRPTRPRVERTMASHASANSFRGKSTIPLPRHRARTVLFARAPQRFSYTSWLGGRVRLTHQLRRDLE